MNCAIVVFPGSNEMDCLHAIEEVVGVTADLVWHTTTDLSSYDAIIIPGGFSYGDYLRSGAIAALSPIMPAIAAAAKEGKPILGIGNGFQILTEAGLLPGTLRQNEALKFYCGESYLTVANNTTPFTVHFEQDEAILIPIAHESGHYYCDAETLRQLENNKQIVLRYAGELPHGSVGHIAGISNEQGNVVGIMPHPERATNEWLGSEDGIRIFTSMFNTGRDQHGTTPLS